MEKSNTSTYDDRRIAPRYEVAGIKVQIISANLLTKFLKKPEDVEVVDFNRFGAAIISSSDRSKGDVIVLHLEYKGREVERVKCTLKNKTKIDDKFRYGVKFVEDSLSEKSRERLQTIESIIKKCK